MSAVTAPPPRLYSRAWPTRFQREQAAAGIDLGKLPGDLKSIGPWILGDMIGRGASGRVKLGRHKYSGKIAAIKIVSKNAMLSSKTGIANMDARHQKALQAIHREIVIMKLINHPCIVSLYDLQETENEFYLALEYVEGGELFDHLVSRGHLSEPEALNYFRQIIFGLDYCHRFNISHRDLKPENILLDKNRNIKIADFGMAALEVANGMLETSCGSPHYASPEIVAGKAYHGASSDIWSCGVVLYVLLTGRLPFDYPDIRTLLQQIMLGEFQIHKSLSRRAQDLIGRMLVVDPEKRITIPEIFQHPFFNGRTNIVFRNPDPPTLEDLSKPIGPREHIESAYLASLQILFHKSRADIERALRVRDEPNWEKAFLYLLRVYAERVRENYGEEDEDEVEEIVPARRRSTHLRVERDVFADITTRLNAGGRRFVDVRPPVKLSIPPVGRKRALTVSTEPQFAVPRESPTKLVAARAAPVPLGAEGRAGRGREEGRASHVHEASRISHIREHSGYRSRPPSVSKLAPKSKPTPLALANPNWHPVSSASQPSTPVLDSPRLGQQPKVTGWFQNLFTFRPVFHILYSTVSPELTRREITQMLSDFGVAVTKQEDQELLKCYVDKFHDLDGTLMTKSVRFRIEIRSTGGSPTVVDMPLRSPMLELPGTQYPCVLTMTQEKGAHSTLKAVYARLRALWRLDSLVSPVPLSAGSTVTTGAPMLE
ncbi:hypothetical protein FRC06_010564 [Ceratobasidium sp. 370]|nr:hypothetical protein FRC06_010564 [Ceratobasidium sp. 370]